MGALYPIFAIFYKSKAVIKYKVFKFFKKKILSMVTGLIEIIDWWER